MMHKPRASKLTACIRGSVVRQVNVGLGRVINSDQKLYAISVVTPGTKTRLGAVTVDFWDIRG
jgi:hypothetical protein